jgi:uncharacterized phage protein (TIGR02220 family)
MNVCPTCGQEIIPQTNLKVKAISVLEHLNKITGKNFRMADVNLSMIIARLKDGITEQTLKTIIVKKNRDWKGTEQEKYLRPATLFNRTKCEQYIGDIGGVIADNEEVS